MQGVGGCVKGTDTIYFIKHEDMTSDRKSTYGHIVEDYFPQKEDPYHTEITVGGDLLNLLGGVGAPKEDMLTSKLLMNIVLSPNS